MNKNPNKPLFERCKIVREWNFSTVFLVLSIALMGIGFLRVGTPVGYIALWHFAAAGFVTALGIEHARKFKLTSNWSQITKIEWCVYFYVLMFVVWGIWSYQFVYIFKILSYFVVFLGVVFWLRRETPVRKKHALVSGAILGLLFFGLALLVGELLLLLDLDGLSPADLSSNTVPQISKNELSEISEFELSVFQGVYQRQIAQPLLYIDFLWPGRRLVYARDLGSNALAATFFLYAGVLMLFIERPTFRFIGTIIAVAFMAMLTSLGSIIAFSLTLICILVSQIIRRFPQKRGLIVSVFAFLAIIFVSWGAYKILDSGGSRVEQITIAYTQIREGNLFLGNGMGAKISQYVEWYGVKERYVHNLLLANWMWFGILGFGFVMCFVIWMLISMLKVLLRCVEDEYYSKGIVVFLLWSPVCNIFLRSSVESLFIHSDWIIFALAVVAMGDINAHLKFENGKTDLG